jgi:DNA-binding transcriptional regulator YhcF (GntR family)
MNYPFSFTSLKKLEKKVCEIIESNIVEHNLEKKKKLLNVKEVSKLMGISITTVHRNVAKFNLYDTVFRIRRNLKFDREEIENKLGGDKHYE